MITIKFLFKFRDGATVFSLLILLIWYIAIAYKLFIQNQRFGIVILTITFISCALCIFITNEIQDNKV